MRQVFNGREVLPKVSNKRPPPEYKKLHYGEADLRQGEPAHNEVNQAHRNLVAAVIASAVYEFREIRRKAINDYASRHSVEFAQSRGLKLALESYPGRWITGDGNKAFGFVWSCVMLDMEPERVRAGILARVSHGRKNSAEVWK